MGLEVINIIRKQKNISLEQLSEMSSVPLGTLSKISAGITKDPKLETIKSIAKALNCSLDEFDDNNKPTMSNEAFSIANAYDKADIKTKSIVKLILDISKEQ